MSSPRSNELVTPKKRGCFRADVLNWRANLSFFSKKPASGSLGWKIFKNSERSPSACLGNCSKERMSFRKASFGVSRSSIASDRTSHLMHVEADAARGFVSKDASFTIYSQVDL